MIEKRCHVPFYDGRPRITILDRHGRSLTKMASVRPEVENYVSRIPRGDDGAHWIHLIALTASEYWGQNRNGDHWSIEALGHLPEGWSGNPELDRELSKTCRYGTGTYYGANVYPHHQNSDPNLAIGSVELVLWNPTQYWVELIIRLDKAKTAQSKVKWVLDRIEKGLPFDVSMGAKVPFDMATTGDMDAYRAAQRTYDPSRHESPAAAVLEYHRRKRASDGIGIFGLSITRNDYIPACKTEMGTIYPDGKQVGVRNDYPRFFDISVVFIGADKVAKYISKIGAYQLRDSLCRMRGDRVTPALDQAYRLLKAAADKQGAEAKEADIIKEVEPPFDDRSIQVLSTVEPDMPEGIAGGLQDHPDLGRVLSTLASMGIILKPKEFDRLVGERDVPQLSADLFDPQVASRSLGLMRHRSALLPSISQRMGRVMRHGHEVSPSQPSERYRGYRNQVRGMLEGGPDKVFERNPDLWVTLLGRRGSSPLVGRMTRRYAELAHMPAGSVDKSRAGQAE